MAKIDWLKYTDIMLWRNLIGSFTDIKKAHTNTSGVIFGEEKKTVELWICLPRVRKDFLCKEREIVDKLSFRKPFYSYNL